MTHGRVIGGNPLGRVEGGGSLHVEVVDGELSDIELRIFEPPRYFEQLLQGRHLSEPPDITARICGICPVAYQMSACRAIEDAVGAVVDGPLRDLRLLLYAGEWIESHTLHVHLLHAPDMFGVDDVVELAGIDRAAVERGLELRRIGDELIELVGGRAVHPVNVRVGGFHRVPTVSALRAVRPRLEQGLELALEVVDWVAGMDIPDADLPVELVALSRPDDYAVLDGDVVTDRGRALPLDRLLDLLVEHDVPRSTARHSLLDGSTRYLVGPLARFAINRDRLREPAADAARRAGLDGPCRNPFRSIVVRAVETVEALAWALDAVDRYEEPDRPAVDVEPVAGVGRAVTEAPRGILHHVYELDDDGLVRSAVIVPPTSQNQATIEADVAAVVAANLDLDDDALRRVAETAVRNHDPCISCAAHFLDLTVTRRPGPGRP